MADKGGIPAALSRDICRCGARELSMGIYDRPYYQDDQPQGLTLRAPQSVVISLIVINVVLWLANGLLTPGQGAYLGAISEALAVHSHTLYKPWLWWQFLTYGFVHVNGFQHVAFNMLGLFFLGRAVEQHLGRWEFLRFYLAALVFGSVAWTVANLMPWVPKEDYGLVGASGAVVAVVILFALNFPRQTLLLFFVLPVPAWVVGVMLVVGDMLQATGIAGPRYVAYSVHLAGAAFAFLYFYFHWNFGRLVPQGFSLSRLKPRPKLRIHDPDDAMETLSSEVDRILEKIHREGEASLTRKERRTMENASREFQRRRGG